MMSAGADGFCRRGRPPAHTGIRVLRGESGQDTWDYGEGLKITQAAWHDLVLESMKQFARDLMPRLESYHPDRRSSLSLAQY